MGGAPRATRGVPSTGRRGGARGGDLWAHGVKRGLGGHIFDVLGTEDVRMTPDHLLRDVACDGIEIESATFPGHARVKHHLKQQIAEFVF